MLSFFPRGVLDGILNLIESVSEGFPSYSCLFSTVTDVKLCYEGKYVFSVSQGNFIIIRAQLFKASYVQQSQ